MDSAKKSTGADKGGAHILVVDDEAVIREGVRRTLEGRGMAVATCASGYLALEMMQKKDFDLVLTDLKMPGMSGLELLTAIKGLQPEVPVIVITARDGVDDRIKGLDFGADDYLVKPFDVNELLARLRAIIRRQGGQAAPVLTNGKVSLDPATREARCGDATELLSAREFALLHALLLRPGAILTRAELEERIYGWNEEVESNAVDFLIHGVRKKLGADVIKNVRGAGWMVSKDNGTGRAG